ncbi:hypothetical protein AHAS_Ahas17G0161000 [Arachis hypogaea]
MVIFGCEPTVSSSSKSYIKLSWVRRHIRDKQPLETWESVQRYVRCHIFYLLGTTFLTDKSTTYAHEKYLSLLHNFEKIHSYSWVAATLTHLYRSECHGLCSSFRDSSLHQLKYQLFGGGVIAHKTKRGHRRAQLLLGRK